MTTSIDSAFERVITWRDSEPFPDGGSSSATLAKLREEANEYERTPSLEELADIFIVWAALAAESGYEEAAIVDAIHAKQAVNEERTWERQSDGTVHHVETEALGTSRLKRVFPDLFQ